MSLHHEYKHLLGLPYISGSQDCYGLVRRYYQEIYQLPMVDFARPDCWWDEPDMNLIDDFLAEDGWESIGLNPRNLRLGDGIVFSLLHGKANHVGVYVGNGNFIHHVYERYSCEEALLQKWTNRILTLVRHKAVTAAREKSATIIPFETMTPREFNRQLALEL